MSKTHVVTHVIILVSIVSLVLSGCGGAARDEIESGQGIEALGGLIIRNENLPGKPIVSVEFPVLNDAGLKEVANLKRLNILKLAGTDVTDAGLSQITGMRSLSYLDLSGTRVTDAGMRELAGVKSLHRLILTNTKVTDAGVAAFEEKVHYCRIER